MISGSGTAATSAALAAAAVEARVVLATRALEAATRAVPARLGASAAGR
jgi:hypothetical protein